MTVPGHSMTPRTARTASRRLASLACAAAVVCACAAADAVTLLTDPSHFGSYGTVVLAPPSDDESMGPYPLGPVFPAGFQLGTAMRTEFYIGDNGDLTLGAMSILYDPVSFPDDFSTGNNDRIAAWFADVDVVAAHAGDLTGVYLFTDATEIVVTWNAVGYYNARNDRRNSFQIVLRNPECGGCGDVEVEFRYATCQWTTGDNNGGTDGLGGTPAIAGFDLPAGTSSVTLPGSLTASVLMLCTTSNVGIDGQWDFCVHSGAVANGFCPSDHVDAGHDAAAVDAALPDVPVVDGSRRDGSSSNDVSIPDDTATPDDAAAPDDIAVDPGPPFPGQGFRGGACACGVAVTRGSGGGAATTLGALAMVTWRRLRRRRRSVTARP